MSAYFGLKFEDVILELPYNNKIVDWLSTCNNVKNWYYDEEINMSKIKESLPSQMFPLMESDNWIIELPNYIYNQKDKFSVTSENTKRNTTLLMLNFTTSFKNNKDNAMQQFLILIKEFIISGNIYLCINSVVNKIDYKKDFICNLFIDGGIRVEFPVYDIKMMSDDEYEHMQHEFTS